MGLAVIKPDDSGKSLYRRADQALYRSKELGRNQLFTLVDQIHTPRQQDNTPVATYEQFKASIESQN
jgi:diguanylate cyclase